MVKRKNNNKVKNNTRIIIIMLAIILIVGITYAYFSSSSISDTNQVTVGNLEVTYTTGQDILANFAIPIEEEEAYLHKFTIENVGTLSSNYSMRFDPVSLTKNSENTTSNNFLWKLYKATEDYKIVGEAIATGAFGSNSGYDAGDTTLSIIENQTLNIKSKQPYVLKVWLNEANVEQNEDQDLSFSARVTVDAKEL